MKLKEQSEDFLVEEIIKKGLVTQDASSHQLYLLEKINYTTERAVQHIAKALRIPRKKISYAGTKDKQARTKQLICIEGVGKEKVSTLQLKDLQVSFVGYAQERLGLGDLEGNAFTIVVRDMDEVAVSVPESFFVPNYFDEQRFSSANVDVGKALLKKDFSKAVQLVMDTDKDFAEKMREHLSKQENDYLGALRLLPRKTLLFFVHAVQSYIFNELLASLVREAGENKEVSYSQGSFYFPKQVQQEANEEELPLVGFDTTVHEKEMTVLNELDITQRDFLIKSIPELTLEGSTRKAFIPVHNCTVSEVEEDELHIGKKKIIVSFSLPKGAYATIVIKQILATL